MKLYPFHKIGLLLLVLCSCNGNRSVPPFEKEGLGEISKINPPQPPLKLSPFVKGGGEHIQDQGDEQLTVNATTTDAEGTSSNDIQEANKLAEIFVLQKQLVYKLLQNIGITSDKLSPAVKIAINKPQTTNVKAFKAFCYCLDLMDKGQFKKAREQCDDAVKYDPNFALAQRLLESIPDHQETMPEIVANHMKSPIIVGLQPKPSEEIVLNTIPPVQLPSDIGAVDLQASEIDRSSPPCGNNGHCGFYSTFLAHSSPENGVTVSSAPFMNRIAVSIPPTNAKGEISINQIGQEGKGFLNLQVDPRNQTGHITGFQDGLANQASNNIANGQLDRIVTHTFSTQRNITGLELGSYLTRFDLVRRLGNTGGGKITDLFHGALYFAEGLVTPVDIISTLGKVRYSGVANGDFSVNGQLVPCQGDCGRFTSTLNYGAGKLEAFKLEANAQQVEGSLTAAAEITANNVNIKPSGEFRFDQTSGGSFRVGTNSEDLSSAQGVVAGRPFGPNGELLGGVFAIHGGNNIQGAGNFGGASTK